MRMGGCIRIHKAENHWCFGGLRELQKMYVGTFMYICTSKYLYMYMFGILNTVGPFGFWMFWGWTSGKPKTEKLSHQHVTPLLLT